MKVNGICMKSFSYNTITIIQELQYQIKHWFHKALSEDETLHTGFILSFLEHAKHENMNQVCIHGKDKLHEHLQTEHLPFMRLKRNCSHIFSGKKVRQLMLLLHIENENDMLHEYILTLPFWDCSCGTPIHEVKPNPLCSNCLSIADMRKSK
jgi:hypothetical protein